jgi:hypothetical protein
VFRIRVELSAVDPKRCPSPALSVPPLPDDRITVNPDGITERNARPNKDDCDGLRLRSTCHRDAFLEGLGFGLHFR